MGYYTGNGVTTSGGQNITQLDTALSGGTLIRERLTIAEVNVKNGISLEDCQTVVSGKNRVPRVGYVWTRCGDLICNWKESKYPYATTQYLWPTTNSATVTVNYSYQQIGGSNLYQLITTTEKMQTRLSASNGAGELHHGDWADLPTK